MLELDALLVGWLEAVDKQPLRPENVGPYLCATRARIGMAKAAVIRDVLAAEELTAQVIVKDVTDEGVCLLGAYRVDADAPDELDELAAALGLPRRPRSARLSIPPAAAASASAGVRPASTCTRRNREPSSRRRYRS